MSTRTCPSCGAPLSNIFGQKTVECDFCGVEVQLIYDSHTEIGQLSDQRFLRLWDRAINSYEKCNFSKSSEIVESLLEKLIESNNFTEDLVKVYDLKFSILIDSFFIDRNFTGKLDNSLSNSAFSKFPTLTISNFFTEILERYEDVVDNLPKELKFTFANYCFQEFFYLFGGNLLVCAEESLEKISKQKFTYSQEVAAFYYFSFIVKIYYSSIKFIEGVYPKTRNKEEINLIKETCINIKKAYSTYLSQRFEKKNKRGTFIDYKILFSKINIKERMSFDGDESIYEEFFELKENFENKWIAEEAKEIDRHIEIQRREEDEILKQKLLEEEMLRKQEISKQNEIKKEKIEKLRYMVILSVFIVVIVGVPIGVGTYNFSQYQRSKREAKLEEERRKKILKLQESGAWKRELIKKEYGNKIVKVDPMLGTQVLPLIKKDISYKNKTINYSNGDKYIGEMRNDKRHGRGTYIWASGSKFSGEFENDFKTDGTYTYVSGNVYKGEFLNEKKHGQGTFLWVNGNKYVGGFFNEKKHGQGTFFWVNGAKYVGQWRNDYMHGKGIMYYSNGDKYVGEYKNDKRHGQGTYSFSSGNTYHSGEWRYDKKYY